MNLTIENIRAAALGVSSVMEENGTPRFHRFSEAETALYYNLLPDGTHPFYDRALCAAGVKLCFCTDSPILHLAVDAEKHSSRSFCSFDVSVNGKLVDSLCNFSEQELEEDYTVTTFPLGKMEKEFSLGEGEKTVSIYFPFAVQVKDLVLTLADGASFIPAKPKKRLLVYGDSITQGYDARYPSRRYGARLANALEAEEINKGIGGEIFRPALAALSDEKDIDYITVAYGTNDWSSTSRETFEPNMRAFYQTLCARYPEAKIFAITPIWRKDLDAEKPMGAFENVKKMIAEAVKDLKNVTLIDGIDLVPHDYKLYADLRLHPRDEGFDYYAENLIRMIKEKI